MRKAAFIAGLAAFAATSALAQGLTRKQQREFIEVIETAEGECDRVTRTNPIGTVGRDTYLAVLCRNGNDYVVIVDHRARITFYATCEAFEEGTNNQLKCT